MNFRMTRCGGRGCAGKWPLGRRGIVGRQHFVRLVPLTFLTIKLCGAAYIAWLGIQLLRTARTPLPSGSASPDDPELSAMFRKGLSTTMANPKAALYYASALSSAAPVDAGFVLLSGMVLSVFVVAAMWFTIVVSVLSTPKAAAAFRRFKVYFESFFGTLLVGFGVRQLISRAN